MAVPLRSIFFPYGYPKTICISGIYITIYKSNKITVMRSNKNNFMAGVSPPYEELYYKVVALGRLGTMP